MKNINIRIPEEVHRKLTDFQSKEKPHMSLNALVVEAILERLERKLELGGR